MFYFFFRSVFVEFKLKLQKWGSVRRSSLLLRYMQSFYFTPLEFKHGGGRWALKFQYCERLEKNPN